MIRCPYCNRAHALISLDLEVGEQEVTCEKCDLLFEVELSVSPLPENLRRPPPPPPPPPPPSVPPEGDPARIRIGDHEWLTDGCCILRTDAPLPTAWDDTNTGRSRWMVRSETGDPAVTATWIRDGLPVYATSRPPQFHARFLPLLTTLQAGSGLRWYRDGEVVALIMPCLGGDLGADGSPVEGGGR